nr:substrate-binding domain-containing protein [Vibrio neptunius]
MTGKIFSHSKERANMIGFIRNVTILSLLFSTLSVSESKQLRFAVVPKEENNPFFEASKEGCMAAAKGLDQVECVYRGPKNVDVRKQDKIISALLDEGIDGIAIAVPQSEYMLQRSIKKHNRWGFPSLRMMRIFHKKYWNVIPR